MTYWREFFFSQLEEKRNTKVYKERNFHEEWKYKKKLTQVPKIANGLVKRIFVL